MKLLLRLSLLSPVFALAYATTLSLDLSDSSIQHDNDAPLTSVIVDSLRSATTPVSAVTLETVNDGDFHSSAFVNQANTQLLSLESEIRTLRQLENDVRDLYVLISDQKGVIHDLAHQSFHAGKADIKQCESASCVAKKVYQHVKMCMHIFYVRYGPSNELEPLTNTTVSDWQPSESSNYTCAAYRRQRLHSTKREECSGFVAHKGAATFNATSTITAASTILKTTPHETVFWILAIFGSLISLLCIAKLIHHCHNDPRRRAERAARREERQKTREYRRAARLQALKNLWHWRQPTRMGDYEEKRALILAQENVLEGVMQQEITQLRLAHGIIEDVVHAAEEGRLPTVDEISRVIAAGRRSRRSGPPTYRSRASSTQPPSYHTDDEEVFMPAAEEGPNITPESSVVNLSPRNSSETLRTLYSMM